MALLDDLRRAGGVSALAREAGVHRETIHARLREGGHTVASALGAPRKGRHAGLCVPTRSGVKMFLSAPRAAMVRLDDIAHALAAQCRFQGATRRFYSEAEHAVAVARRVLLTTGGYEAALAALHRSSHKAYIGPMPRPVRALLGAPAARLAARVDAAVAAAFGLDFAAAAAAAEEADQYFFCQEALAFGLDGEVDGAPARRALVSNDVLLVEDFPLRTFQESKDDFLTFHLTLTESRVNLSPIP